MTVMPREFVNTVNRAVKLHRVRHLQRPAAGVTVQLGRRRRRYLPRAVKGRKRVRMGR